MRHLYANLWLLALTLALCSVAYPLVLLVIAQVPFLKDRAEGSLLRDAGGNIIGSRLEAQPFSEDDYFWPRPSAASYDGRKSGASNLSANNPALRSQVENRLGSVLKYGPKSPKKGEMIRGDVEKWFAIQKGLLAKWAEENSESAKAWVKSTEPICEFIKNEKDGQLAKHLNMWLRSARFSPGYSAMLGAYRAEDKPEELAVPFMTWFSETYPGSWPGFEKEDGKPITPTKLQPVKENSRDIQNNFYPMWREAHPDVDLDPVPADMVTTSGSGLDPHITLKSALYQFDRVASKWAEKCGMTPEQTARRLHKVLDAHTHAPLGGLAGVPMVNVMELNFALKNSEW